MKVAIAAEWISKVGGHERVLQQLHKAFPEAPIFVATYEPGDSKMFKNADIRTSWMQKLPKPLRKHQLLTIPRQWYFGALKLRGYDVVISAGSAEAKALRAPDGKHINICYTPTLQYWVKPDNYLNKDGSDSVNIFWRTGLRLLMPYVRWWDRRAAQRPDRIMAISEAVQQRIKNHYQRRSDILHPPVDMERFSGSGNQNRDGFIIVGRHVGHKRIDLAIRACNELGKKLIVIGDGPETPRLKDMAGPTIEFKGRISDEKTAQYLAQAEAFLFPNEEDFGIVAVEAQAAGTPVIGYRAGGALDIIEEGVTGEFFDKQSPESLMGVMEKFNYKLYNHQAIVQNAARFASDHFRAKIQAIAKET